MTRVRIFALGSLLVMLSLVLLVFLGPSLIVPAVMRYYIASLGLSLVGLQNPAIGINQASLDHLLIGNSAIQLSIDDLQISYEFSDLIRGKLFRLEISSLELELSQNTNSTTAAESSLIALLNSMENAPVERIDIANMAVKLDDSPYSLTASLAARPYRLNGTLRDSRNAALQVDFRAELLANNIAMQANTTLNQVTVAESAIDVQVFDTALTVNATTNLHLPALLEELTTEVAPTLTGNSHSRTADDNSLHAFLSALSVQDDQLVLEIRTRVNSVFSNPALEDLQLFISTRDSTLNFQHEAENGFTELAVDLPLSVFGKSASLSSDLELSGAELNIRSAWSSAQNSAAVELSFSRLRLSCISSARCTLQARVEGDSPTWLFSGISAGRSEAYGLFTADWANREVQLEAAEIILLMDEVSFGSVHSSGEVELSDFNFRTGISPSLDFTFASRNLSLESNNFNTIQPVASGRLSLREQSVTSYIETSVSERLQVGAALNHHFLRNSGDIEIQIAPIEFSNDTPLSSLLQQTEFSADIVAGNVRGQSNLSWSKQDDSSWEIGGPLRLSLENLSGYYRDYLFVNFSSEIFSEVSNSLGVASLSPQSATMESLDIGLPFENTVFNYRFDTNTGRFDLNDLSSEVLGGSIEISAFDYDPQRELNELGLVISDIDIESIVALANYPGIVVDGLLSGYLPMQLQNGTLLIEEGLVAALAPGGAIKYTPASSAPSSNPSIRLVNDALSNYQYETMDTEVHYDDRGDLSLAVQLRGTNPDMNNGQEINVNLNITDNIPTLLRSLQASRIITDELEKRLREQ